MAMPKRTKPAEQSKTTFFGSTCCFRTRKRNREPPAGSSATDAGDPPGVEFAWMPRARRVERQPFVPRTPKSPDPVRNASLLFALFTNVVEHSRKYLPTSLHNLAPIRAQNS